jgi:ribosomal subunit interface protein
MATPQITYRGMPSSPAMEARIVELSEKLDEFHDKISRCHVVMVETDKHKTKGNLFECHLDVHIPGHDVVATQKSHEDAYAAITQAFDVAFRQLEHFARMDRGEVKVHRNDRGDSAQPT